MPHVHFDCHHLTAPPGDMARRGFLAHVGLGAGAAMLMSFAPGIVRAAGGTDALLLSCMDYRLVDDIVKYMDGRGMNGKYDHVVLAGASLGALNDKNTSWGQTFWEHVGVAIDLHHIHKVIVLDHRDCGAYKVFLGPEHAKDAATELASHAGQLHKLRDEIKRKHAALEVELLLMSLDGSVETVS